MGPYLVRMGVGATLGALAATGILLLLTGETSAPIVAVVASIAAVCSAPGPVSDEDDEAEPAVE